MRSIIEIRKNGIISPLHYSWSLELFLSKQSQTQSFLLITTKGCYVLALVVRRLDCYGLQLFDCMASKSIPISACKLVKANGSESWKCSPVSFCGLCFDTCLLYSYLDSLFVAKNMTINHFTLWAGVKSCCHHGWNRIFLSEIVSYLHILIRNFCDQ